MTSAADLSVNGQIRPESACSITLGNGGVVDLGSLTRTELSPPGQTDHLMYKGREMSLMINCPQPTKVSVTATDNRDGTAPFEYYDWHGLGLGNPAIGFYMIDVNGTPSKADGKDAFVIKRGLSGWYNPGFDAMSHRSTISWGVDEVPPPEGWRREPVAFKTLTSMLGISIALIVRKDVGVGDGMELDGSVTLELGYL
nr:DUF1120 domain-containing protein [Burkholderia contaminans]